MLVGLALYEQNKHSQSAFNSRVGLSAHKAQDQGDGSYSNTISSKNFCLRYQRLHGRVTIKGKM